MQQKRSFQGAPFAVTQLHRSGVAQASLLGDCWSGFTGLFSSCLPSSPAPQSGGSQNQSGTPSSQGYVSLTPPVVAVEKINELSINSQDNVAGRAYKFDATGLYSFGLITCCTIVYARGSTCGTAAHFFGTTCKVELARGLLENIDERGDTLSHVKVFFSAEAKQDPAVLSSAQTTFTQSLSKILGRASYEYYVYNAYNTTILLKANGSFATPIEKEVTRAQ